MTSDELYDATDLPLSELPALAALHRQARGWSQGALVVQCLGAYQNFAGESPERALASVYCWALRVACGKAEWEAKALAKQFLKGKQNKARQKAAQLYADCLVAHDTWLRSQKVRGIR